MSHSGGGIAWIPAELQAAIARVTAEDFRVEDFRFDRDVRLGRQVLFLLSHTEWTRRTTEQVQISRVRSVDTEVVVDVDLSYAVHSGLRPYGDRLWLPLFTVPTALPPGSPSSATAPVPGTSAAASGLSSRQVPTHGPSDPMTSLEVSDAAGARVPKVPQTEVQYWIAAALAELLLRRLPRDPADSTATTGRDELVLLAAAFRWLLAGHVPDGEPVGAPSGAVTARPVARRGERIGTARAALSRAIRDDLARARPALSSRLGHMIDAVYGTTLVVVGVDRSAGPTSFTIRMPARRLHQTRRRHRWQTPRARIGIDLLTASANTDRLIRLTLPEGVTYLPRRDPTGRQYLPPARIEVQQPRVFHELRALTQEVLGKPGRGLTRARQRLARMGVQQVDACLPVLEQYRITAEYSADPGDVGLCVREKLALLQDGFRSVVAATDLVSGGAALDRLRRAWADGDWLPDTLQRRVLVNTDTPGVVHLRATAAEGAVVRASPTDARLDLEVAVTESTVLDTARDTSLITMGLLAVVTVLTAVNRGGLSNLDAQTLATVLVLFPAIQAGRIERPDRGSLRGLLAQSTYLLSLATVFPPVVLAAALALHRGGLDPRVLALGALAAQGLLHLVLRRRPPGELTSWARPAALLLQTDQRPDLAGLDRIRGRSCRSLIAEALLLGREAHAYIARDREQPGALEQLLTSLDGERDGVVARRGDPGGLLGLIRSGVGGQALTFVVHGRQARQLRPLGPWGKGPAGPQLLAVPFAAARLAPVESPAWIVETLIGMPRGVARRLRLPHHPLTRLARACRESGFPILLVQHPSPPPVHGLPGQEWLRVRVSVPYVPGEDLVGLRRFFEVVDALRDPGPGRPACSVHVYVTPELATYEAAETAADEASRRGGSGASGGSGALGTRLAGAVDVVGEDPGPVLPVALCSGARVGLVGDLLDVVAVRRPDVRLAGITVALLHGLTVGFLYCTDGRDAEPGVDPGSENPGSEELGSEPLGSEPLGSEPLGSEPLGSEPLGADPGPDAGLDPGADGAAAVSERRHPASGLGALIRAELEGTDDVHVAVEADAGPVPGADPAVSGAVPVPWAAAADGAGAAARAAGRPGPLLRLQLRTPDRAGVVPTTLERVTSVVRGAGAVPSPGLDVWFALLRVVDGRSLQGRMGIWLPVGDWQEADWSAVTEDEQRYLPEGRDAGPPLVEDDPSLTVNIARVLDDAVPAPAVGAARQVPPIPFPAGPGLAGYGRPPRAGRPVGAGAGPSSAGKDGASEAGPEVGPDAGPQIGPDAGQDLGQDLEQDLGQEVGIPVPEIPAGEAPDPGAFDEGRSQR